MLAKALGIVLCGCVATAALVVGGAGLSSAAPAGTTSAGARLEARAAAVRGWTSERRLHAAGVQAAALPFSASVSDPTGDVVPSEDARADVVAALASATATGYRLSVKVKSPTDPKTDPNWQNLTGPAWLLDTNLDDNPDYTIVMVAGTDGSLSAGLFDFNAAETDPPLCVATSAQYTSSHTYDATFDTSCPVGVQHFAWQAAMQYDVGPTQFDDAAPDDSAAPAIAVPLPAQSGYWMLGADGVVYPFGAAAHFGGSVPHATAMTPRRDGKGYWVVDASGHVFAHGAPYEGGAPALAPFEIITTIAATPSNNGYWLISNRGRVFPFGDAKFLGDMSKVHLNGPVVASVATPTGHGYYMVGSDGGIFTFGDAHFHGSMGGTHLNKPIVGLSPTPNNAGYWLVGSDGGVFAFNAPFRGSMGGTHLNKPVNGLVAFGNGYLMVASDGGIFDFSNKPFFGSLVGKHLSAPIIGLAAFSN